jgi:hypothetical protein
MSTVIHPVGPKRPEIYWRRRLLALVITVLLLVAMMFGVKAAVGALVGGDEKAETPAEEQQEAPDASAADDSAPAGPAECAPEQISLVAISDATSYAAGATAAFGMRITNTGKADCTMDAGSAALELTVVSGKDRIWSSDDCQESAQNVPTTVSPGEEGALESSVEWALVRSAKGCAKDLPAVKPGTYQLVARAGELTSPPLVFAVK